MNKGTLRGASGGVVAFPKVVNTSVATSQVARPAATTGLLGDVSVGINDYSNIAQAWLWPPKAADGTPAGAWSATGAWGPDGEKIPLVYRHKSQLSSPLIPGWSLLYSTSWMTGTAPTDMLSAGTWGGAFYSNSAGTYAYLGRTRQVGTGASMPFFSCELTISTLPEASRFAWVGQLGESAALYGFAARVDSAGVVELWRMDGVYGNARIGTGTFTIGVNDTIVLERFGYRMTAGRVATSTRDLISSFSVNLRNSTTSGYDGFAANIGAQSYGYATDANSVRVSRLEFSG